jgi:hypothetical protein
MRTLRKIVEEPDIAPTFRNAWLPPFGGRFETAIVHFSIRTLLRSRQHRMIFAFYLGAGLAFALLFLNAPAELAGPVTESPWSPLSVPLLASTIVLMGFWVRGARVVFALPLDLRANWIFRIMPFAAGRECLRARRRALWAVSILPAWLISAAVLFWFWPWRLAAAHLTLVACVGVVLAEFSTDSAQRLPFTCSWLPGRSNLHVTFWLWIYLILAAILGAAITERKALQSPASATALLAVSVMAALFFILRNNREAARNTAELRYEEVAADQLLSLDLS